MTKNVKPVTVIIAVVAVIAIITVIGVKVLGGNKATVDHSVPMGPAPEDAAEMQKSMQNPSSGRLPIDAAPQ